MARRSIDSAFELNAVDRNCKFRPKVTSLKVVPSSKVNLSSNPSLKVPLAPPSLPPLAVIIPWDNKSLDEDKAGSGIKILSIV